MDTTNDHNTALTGAKYVVPSLLIVSRSIPKSSKLRSATLIKFASTTCVDSSIGACRSFDSNVPLSRAGFPFPAEGEGPAAKTHV